MEPTGVIPIKKTSSRPTAIGGTTKADTLLKTDPLEGVEEEKDNILDDDELVEEGELKTYFTKEDYAKEAKKMKAIMFLMQCDARRERYGDLMKHLEDKDVFGEDNNRPTTVASAFALLNREALNIIHCNRQNTNLRGGRGGRGGHGGCGGGNEDVNLMFAQWEKCDDLGLSYGQPMSQTFQFIQDVPQDSNWVILDTGSTCSSTNQPHMLDKLHDSDIQVVTNTRTCCFSQKGTFTFFPLDMYYHGDSLTTVLSFHKL